MSVSSVVRPQRRTGRAARIALAAAGVVVAALVAEGLLRLTAYHRQFAQRDATLGYVLTPHFTRLVPAPEHSGGQVVLRTNNLGLRRDRDVTVAKSPGTRRVLVLGDSQTEGIVDNPETYAAQLERTLNAKSGSAQIEVLNAGASGYSPLLEYLWWRERGAPLQPDIVVLALYVGNDIAELLMQHEDFGGFGPRMRIPYFGLDGGSRAIVLPGAGDGFVGRIDWLLETHLQIYALVHRVVQGAPPIAGPEFGQIAAHCPGCLQTIWQAWIAHGTIDGLAEGFARLDDVFARCSAAGARAGIPFIVAIIPSRAQVEPAAVAEATESATQLGLQYNPAAFDDAVETTMIALAARHKLITVDLLPALRAAAAQSGRPLYWSLDWHLNPQGHTVVAETLAPVLAERLHVGRPAARTE